MAITNTPIAPATRRDPDIDIGALVRPFMLRWRLVCCAVLLVMSAGAVVTFVPARRYQGTIVLAAVPNTRNLSLGSGIGAILGGAQLGGVQSTPYFVTRLLLLRSVIVGVAASPVSGTRDLVVERVVRKPLRRIKPADVERKMRKILNVEVDKQTGLVTLTVTHRDSAVVRQVASQLVAAASKTYIDVIRAQASSQRAAQEVRVDSAQRQLRRAEEALAAFISSNRTYAVYSATAITRQRIERELSNAQSVYAQAITDRETAVARELEATPAVVVVDSLPAQLLPESRNAPLKLMLAAFLGVALAGAVMMLSGDFNVQRASDSARHQGRADEDA